MNLNHRGTQRGAEGKYKAYPEYKNTNILGMEEIPVKWDVKKVKFVFHLGRGRVIAQEELEDEGQYPVYSSQTKNNGCLGFIETYDFDCKQITWTTDGANAGTVFLREGKHNCTNVCGTLQPKYEGLNLEYSLYCLDYVTQFHKRPDTNGAKIMNGEMGEIFLSFPSIEEQKQIAAFLDRETAKIDALIDKQKKLIALLKEKRQATISHAVTKGLNPNAPMKDSGIPWLGKIPAHWEITQIKRIAELNPSKGQVENKKNIKCSFVPMEKLKTDSLVLDETRLINDVYDGYTYFSDGDVLMAKVTPCFENKNIAIANHMVNGIGFGSSEIYVLRCNDNVVKKFLFYRLQEDTFMELATGSMTGAGGLKRVPSEMLNNFTLALPPVSEQQEILDTIESKLNVLKTLEVKAEQAIELIQERRTALISAAVTGKIDVRSHK